MSEPDDDWDVVDEEFFGDDESELDPCPGCGEVWQCASWCPEAAAALEDADREQRYEEAEQLLSRVEADWRRLGCDVVLMPLPREVLLKAIAEA